MESFGKIDEVKGFTDVPEGTIICSILLCAVDLKCVVGVHSWADIKWMIPDEKGAELSSSVKATGETGGSVD